MSSVEKFFSSSQSPESQSTSSSVSTSARVLQSSAPCFLAGFEAKSLTVSFTTPHRINSFWLSIGKSVCRLKSAS